MKWNLPVIGSVALLFFGTSLSVRATDPTEVWMDGYLHLQSARNAEESGDLSRAMREYFLAIDTYRDLADSFPKFERDRCKKRITLLINKIEALGGDPWSGSRSVPELTGVTRMLKMPENWTGKIIGGMPVITQPLVQTPETRAYHAEVQRRLRERNVFSFSPAVQR